MVRKLTNHFNPKAFLTKVGGGKTIFKAKKNQNIFSQGDPAEAVFAILEPASFFGEACLAGETFRMATATSLEEATILRIDKQAMIDVLHKEPAFSALFMGYLLSRNIRIQEDLVDQLFNSSEKRLARILLLLAHFGKDKEPETAIAKISQETLAEMVGTTRSRVSFFLNKFRKLGFIEYNGGLRVHGSLLNVVLHD